jgi:alkanesulfonate monooxygenase SsuD/methylene tetrahydromethanopterin reductase-like flavin-dependent oxidoreductase (luciferase family)
MRRPEDVMAADNDRVSFGIKTSQAGLTYDQVLRVWREAETVPEFEHAWLWDHLVPLRGDVTGPALEAWTLLTGLAAQTSRLRLGVIVTSNRIRHPALLAKMAAAVDIIAGGRLVFGIGAGGAIVRDPAHLDIVHREYDAFGIALVTPGEAVAALGETCALVEKLWAEDRPFDFDGQYYHLKGAICEPKPVQRPRPPIMIGSAGERSGLRLVARHADIWASPTFTAADFRRKNAVLDGHCTAIGRDPAEIIRSASVYFTADEPAADGSARFPGPAGARELLTDLIGAGARHLVLAPIGTPSPLWIADEIIRPVLAASGGRG